MLKKKGLTICDDIWPIIPQLEGDTEVQRFGPAPLRARTSGKDESVWESWLLSVQPCVFCEGPDALVNFHEHFLSPAMSIFLPNWSTLKWFHEWLSWFSIKFPSFLRSKPLPDSVFDCNSLSTSVPKNHPLLHPFYSLFMSITSDGLSLQNHFSQGNKVLSLYKNYCIYSTWVGPTQLSRAAGSKGTTSLTHRQSELPYANLREQLKVVP